MVYWQLKKLGNLSTKIKFEKKSANLASYGQFLNKTLDIYKSFIVESCILVWIDRAEFLLSIDISTFVEALTFRCETAVWKDVD